ncbi:hypothetical protein FOZ60_015866 [Perkinsus olseni]|uniref:Uncharacterized protein n=1 Tax=Perkinsus olseni TaxID=32597 RepID=A0A7J6N565_PEROL|nr:hypothetical protein FOZ60_015866 [Perkinsus olseni]
MDAVKAALGEDGTFSALPESVVEDARDAIVRIGRAFASDKDQSNPNTPLSPGLWRIVGELAGDGDSHLHEWLREGAPVGISRDLSPGGWFPASTTADPPADDEWRDWVESHVSASPTSCSNYHSAESDPDNTWALLKTERQAGFCSFFDNVDALCEAVGSKDIVVTKIALATKPHTSPPKFRLICDARENRLNTLVRCSERIVLSRIADVVQSIHELAEIGGWSGIECLSADFQNAFKLITIDSAEKRFHICFFQGVWILLHVLMFGVKSSPLVWCRYSSAACRSSCLRVSVPSDKFLSMLELAKKALSSGPAVCSKLLRRLCGKLCWSGQVVPFIHSLLGPLWKAVSAAEGKCRKSSSWVLVSSVRRSLLWFKCFLERANRVAESCGLGGFLSIDGSIEYYFHDKISQHDVKKFGAAVGDHRYQGLWEALALLVAVRLWRKRLPLSVSLLCRSDSRTAIGAALKLRSSSPSINQTPANERDGKSAKLPFWIF